MSQQVYDIDTVGYNEDVLGDFFDFYVNNTFYLLAPPYYQTYYSIYLRRCLGAYDGWIRGFHNAKSGLVPQRMLQSVASGLANTIFAKGIDFQVDDEDDYYKAVKWAKQTKLYQALKKGYKFAIAGGTSLLKINRDSNFNLFVSAHRIDTFFADVNGFGDITSVRVFYDAITNTNPNSDDKKHYGICEERYFNENNQPCVKQSVYCSSGNLQTEVQARPISESTSVSWEQLPKEVKRQIKKFYPSIMIGKEQLLPFRDTLGCYLLKFTEDVPQVPNSIFGQPIGDILFTENFQYDQMKYFEKNEVDLARARALLPEQYWNQDDPMQDRRALSDRFYQKVSGNGTDDDKITPIQFLLRGNDIKTVKENIYKDIAFKIGVSASTIASFLNEGAGARTATEIISERTKTDTWISGQINLNTPSINEMLGVIMRLLGLGNVEIILKPENQAPELETLKANADVYSMGNMSPELFVKRTYKNLTEKEQAREIAYLKYMMGVKEQQAQQQLMAQQQTQDTAENLQSE